MGNPDLDLRADDPRARDGEVTPGRTRSHAGRHSRPSSRRQTLTLAGGVAAVAVVTMVATAWLVAQGPSSPVAAVLSDPPSATSTAASPSSTSAVSGSPLHSTEQTSAQTPSTLPTDSAGSTSPALTANYVDAWIPMPQSRLDEMAQYAQARYGTPTSTLNPSMIVLHFTEGGAQGTISLFAQDIPQSGVYPGVCAHFVVDQAGSVFRLVPTTIMCRHVVGLNDKAIGIEIEQWTYGNSSAWADQQILDRPAQIDAVLATVKDLQRHYGIATNRVIGHAMANDDPEFRDLTGTRNDHTDMGVDAVMEVRRRLDALP